MTTVFVDSGSTTLGNVATFTRVVATETNPITQSAVSLVKRVTAGTTLDNDHGGPGILFSRGYGTTNLNDTQFALIGARYRGITDIHEIRFLTSTDAQNYTALLTLSTENADFNMPVGMNAYANLTAINAIANPAAGQVVYNTDTGTLFVRTGSQWNDVGVVAQTAYTLPAASTSSLGGVIVPAVTTSGITNSSGTIGLATASTTQLGAVKVDGTTITISGSGVVSANTSYTLPTATTSVLGGVKVDGSTITINGSGVISSNSTNTLTGLTDTDITTPANNALLIYNTASNKWIDSNIVSSTGAPDISFERQTNAAAGGATSLFGALAVIRRITDATTGYDEGGAAVVFRSVGTDNVTKSNALIGAYNNTGDVSDFAVKTSNNGGTTFLDTIVSSQSRTNINQGVLYVDKTNNRVGVNDTAPEYALDVTGQVRATAGFIGNLAGNADTATNGVVTTTSYDNPSFINTLAYSKLTGTPTVSSSLDSLTDVTIAAPAKGKMLIYSGAQWIDTRALEFDNTAQRPQFISNHLTGQLGTAAALEVLKRTGNAPESGDGAAILFGFLETNNTRYTPSRISSTWDPAGAHRLNFQASTDNFVSNSSTVFSMATSGSTVNSSLQVTGDFRTDGGNIRTAAAQANIFNDSVITDMNIGNGVQTEIRLGNDIVGSTVIKSPTLQATGAVTVAGDLAVATNVLFADVSANSVGINTASPTSNLHVVGTSNITGAAVFGSTVQVAGVLSTVANASIGGDLTVSGGLLQNINAFFDINTSLQTITSGFTAIDLDKLVTFIMPSGSHPTALETPTGNRIRQKIIVNGSTSSVSFQVINAGWKSGNSGSVLLQRFGTITLLRVGNAWYVTSAHLATLS